MLWLVVTGEVLKIPPRSPDLNPIENIFRIVSRKLEKDAILIRELLVSHIKSSAIECGEQSIVFLTS